MSSRADLPTMCAGMRRVLLALALLALAAGLTACGVTKAVDPVAAAATKTQGSGGYKATTTVTVSAAGKRLTMTGHGLFAPDRGEMDMDLGGILGALGGGSAAGSTMKAIYLTENGDHVMYLNLAFLSSMLPGGKSWIRIDLEKAGKAAGIDVNQLMSGAGQNPSDSLALLRAHGDFSKVGTETVEGVETTHYHGTVDLQKEAEAKGLPPTRSSGSSSSAARPVPGRRLGRRCGVRTAVRDELRPDLEREHGVDEHEGRHQRLRNERRCHGATLRRDVRRDRARRQGSLVAARPGHDRLKAREGLFAHKELPQLMRTAASRTRWTSRSRDTCSTCRREPSGRRSGSTRSHPRGC